VGFATETNVCDNTILLLLYFLYENGKRKTTEEIKQLNKRKKEQEKKVGRKKVIPAPRVEPRVAGFQIPTLNQRTTLVHKFP